MKGIKTIVFDNLYQVWKVIFTDSSYVTGKTEQEAFEKACRVLAGK